MLVLVLATFCLGLLGNRWWTAKHQGSDDEGFGISDLVGPVATLAVVLLAFMLVQSLGSYSRARDDIGIEARRVDALSESAARLADREAASRVGQDLVCYARAVRFKEWKTMATGDRAPEVAEWTGRMQDEMASLARQGGDGEVDRFISLDLERANARLSRITESSPTIPVGLNVLMLGAVLIAVLSFGLFVGTSGSRLVLVSALAVLTVLLGGMLFMVNDLDDPFAGVNKLDPTEMARTQESIERDLAEDFPSARPPCDDAGSPTRDAEPQ